MNRPAVRARQNPEPSRRADADACGVYDWSRQVSAVGVIQVAPTEQNPAANGVAMPRTYPESSLAWARGPLPSDGPRCGTAARPRAARARPEESTHHQRSSGPRLGAGLCSVRPSIDRSGAQPRESIHVLHCVRMLTDRIVYIQRPVSTHITDSRPSAARGEHHRAAVLC